MSNLNKSFTLIEILVVIVIIGILSGFIIVSMAGVSAKAGIAKSQAFANSIRNSLLLELVSEWKLNGNGTDAWGTNDGTVTGATTISSGCVKDSCLSFDGIDDNISCGDTASLNFAGLTSMTVEGWIKPSAVSGTYTIINRHTDGTNAQGTLRIQTNKLQYLLTTTQAFSQQSSSASLSPNVWQHIVFTWNGSLAKFYINSLLDTNQVSLSGSIVTLHAATWIGNDAGGGTPFGGLIDEMRIYKGAVSSSQIKENYYAGLNDLLTKNQISREDYGQRLALLD